MASTSTPTAEALLQALGGHPGATAAELADTAGIGRSTASKLLAALAANGRVLRQPGGREGGRRSPDRWTLLASTPTTPPGDPAAASTTASPATGEAAKPAQQPQARRLGAGELRRLVLAYLADRPGQALSPTAIATALGRSAGAVANALGILVSQGAVVQTQTTPRRYAITHDNSP
jgi:hypothetical protein